PAELPARFIPVRPRHAAGALAFNPHGDWRQEAEAADAVGHAVDEDHRKRPPALHVEVNPVAVVYRDLGRGQLLGPIVAFGGSALGHERAPAALRACLASAGLVFRSPARQRPRTSTSRAMADRRGSEPLLTSARTSQSRTSAVRNTFMPATKRHGGIMSR